MTDAPSTSTYLLVTGDTVDLPNSRVLAVDQGLGLVDDGTFVTITPEDTLGALQDLAGVGIVCMTGANTAETRTLTSGTTLQIVNPAGVAGNPIIEQIPSSSLQLINVLANGTSVGNTSILNLKAGTNAGVSCQVNGEQIDCTFTASGGGGGGAPVDAFYVTTKANSTLTNEVSLGALTDGLLQISVTGGTATIDSIGTTFIADLATLFLSIGPNAGTTPGGDNNTFLGAMAGSTSPSTSDSTFVGANAGSSQSNYSGCTLVGGSADASVGALTNANAFGFEASVAADNTMVLGKPGTRIVIGSDEGSYSLNLNGSGQDNSIFMSQTASPITPGISGGDIYVDSSNNLQYLTSSGSTSGQVVVAIANGPTDVAANQSLLLGNGTHYTAFAHGTDGQVLKISGTSVVWGAAGGGGTTVYSGTATLSAGTVTVSNINIATGSKIVVTYDTLDNPGILSAPSASIVNATSFVINSTNAADDSNVTWHFV